MSAESNKRAYFLYLAVFLFGIIFFYFRNPDPVNNPVVYAEDGKWVAIGLREGWLKAILYSRPDYFVFLNTILLYLSTVIATVTNGGLIDHLPYTIAFVSYAFFSGFALLVFATFRKVASNMLAALGWVLVLMLPLGTTQNEIIGRILQIGFFMPALAVMLFFWRDRTNGVPRAAIDLAIFVSAGTNPVVFVLAFLYFVRILVSQRLNLLETLKGNWLLAALLGGLALAILPRLGGQGGVPGELVPSNIIEAVVGRSFLFPVLFPWYGKLSDAWSVVIFFIFVSGVFAAFKVSTNAEAKKLAYAVITAIVVYTSLTMLMRPGLTGWLNHYQTSFPDRYFMGINVLVSMLAVLTVLQLMECPRTRIFGSVVGISLFLVYVLHYSDIIEPKESRMPIRAYWSFKDQICSSQRRGNLYDIGIYPDTTHWRMLVPAKYVSQVGCRPYDDSEFARPGAVYKLLPTAPLEKQRSIPLNIYDSRSKRPVSRVEIMFGTYMRSNPGDALLSLQSANGRDIRLRFSLAELLDNKYKSFDVPEDIYVSGHISSLTGQGISVWESHRADGQTLTCIKYIFADKSTGFTPGCPKS